MFVMQQLDFEFYWTNQRSAHSDTEYYDYGHGEAQETSYESYGKVWLYFGAYNT